MVQSLTHLRAAWRIIVAKPLQIRRLLLPPFLLAMALKAWLSVQATGQVWPDLPPAVPVGPELAVRAALGLALAVMGLLWHRAIYFGSRAPLSPKLALRYWGQGAVLSALAAMPFLPLVLGWVPRQAVFAADAVSLWLVLCFGIVIARAAGGERVALRAVWSLEQAGASSVLAVVLALVLLVQNAAVSALAALHSGAAFLLDATLTFALIVMVLTLMSRPAE